MTTTTDSMLAQPYPAFLSVPELSAYLGIKTKTLYAKIEAGEIPHYRIGRLVRFRLDEINAWLESCRNNAPQSTEHGKSIRRERPYRPRSNDHVSAIIAKTIDEEHEKYYPSNHEKSGRIEDFGKEVQDGTV